MKTIDRHALAMVLDIAAATLKRERSGEAYKAALELIRVDLIRILHGETK